MAKKSATSLGRVASAIKNVRTEANKGVTFKLRVDDKELRGIAPKLRQHRSDAARGAQFNIKTDLRTLNGIQPKFNAIRRDAVRGAEFNAKMKLHGINEIQDRIREFRADSARGATFNVRSNIQGLNVARAGMNALRAEAAAGVSMAVHVATSGITQAIAYLQALDSKAADVDSKWGHSVNIHTTYSGDAYPRLQYLDAYANSMNGKRVTMYTTVIGSEEAYNNLTKADLAAMRAHQRASNRIVYYADAETQPALAALFNLMDIQGLAVKASEFHRRSMLGTSMALSNFSVMAALASGAIVPIIGGLTTLGTMAVGAVAGLGLISGAISVLKSGAYDGGVAAEVLAAKWASMGEQMVQALGPASLSIAHVAYELMDVAENYIPLLGDITTSTAARMAEAFGQFGSWLAPGNAGFEFMLGILTEIDEITPLLTQSFLAFGQGVIATMSAAAPYATDLAAHIRDIAYAFSTWAQSEEGQAQIRAAIELAIPVFLALEDAVFRVGAALLDLSMSTAPYLPPVIYAIGYALEAIISAFDYLIEEIGLVGMVIANFLGILGAFTRPLITLATRLWLLYAPLAAMLALSYIVVDVVVNFPDMVSAFWEQYQAAREGGAGIGSAVIEGINAAIDETAILSLFAGIGDAIIGWIDQFHASLPEVSLLDKLTGVGEGEASIIPNLQAIWDGAVSWLSNLVLPDVSIMDVLFTSAEASENPLLSMLITAWEGVTGWLGSLVPERSLMDILFGSEGGVPIGESILTALGEAWTGVTEWLSSLVPETSLMDVLMGIGGAMGGEGTIGEQLLLNLQESWGYITEWLGGLVPEVNLLDVLMGAVEYGGDLLTAIITPLTEAWAGIMEWMSTLIPEFSLIDVLFGAMEYGGDILMAILTPLQEMWAGVLEWLSTLVPEISLIDILMGLGMSEDAATRITEILNEIWFHITEIWNGIVEDVSRAMSGLWQIIVDAWNGIYEGVAVALQTIYSYVVSIWDSVYAYVSSISANLWTIVTDYWTQITTAISTALTTIYQSYIVYYWDLITTYISTALTTIYESYIVYYWDLISTYISEALLLIYESYIVYYWDLISTYIYDMLTVIYNDYIVYYWDLIGTYIYDALTLIYNDYIVYYWDLISTYIYDMLTVIYNDYIVYYWDLISTYISDALTTIYNDYIVYYFDSISTYISDTWTAITDGVSGFIDTFTSILVDGIQAAVESALGWFGTLLDGVSSVLGAIGATSTQGAVDAARAALPTGSAYHGASTDQMAHGGVVESMRVGGQRNAGGQRGGMGTKSAHPKYIEWNEQGNGREWWIAPGDGNRKRQERLLSGAANDLNMTVVPRMAHVRGQSNTNYNNNGKGGNNGRMYHGGNVGSDGNLHMAIGGGVDYGPGGLNQETYDVAADIVAQFGGTINTYADDYGYGGVAEHGGVGYQFGHTNTFDIWGDGGVGDPVGYDRGYAIWDYIEANYGDRLATVIFDYYGVGGYGAFDDDDHDDHIHIGLMPSGESGGSISGTFGAAAGRLFQVAAGMWNDLTSSLGTPSFGEGPLWDGVEEFAGTFPDMAYEFIKSNIPRGTGSFGSLPQLSSDKMTAIEEGVAWAGWPADEAAALIELWSRESGPTLDEWAINPDSGAYGIPQINPGAHGEPVPLGDAAAQIAWGIDYIAQRYGTPSAALEFWDANMSYARGGSTDILSMAAGGFAQPGFTDVFPEMRRYEYQPVSNEDALAAVEARREAARAKREAAREKRLARRERRRARRQGITSTGGTYMTSNQSAAPSSSTTTSSTSRTSGSSYGGGRGGGGGGGGGRLTSQPISQSGSYSGSGNFTDYQNTGQTSGGGRINFNPRSTYSANSSVNRSVGGGAGGGAGGYGGGGGGRGNRRRAGGRRGTTSGGQYGGYGSGAGTSFANVQMTRSRYHGGFEDSIGSFVRGGDVPGIGPRAAIVHGGERVLPRNLNQGFQRLAVAIDKWESGSAIHRNASPATGDNAVLEEIRDELREGFSKATPVKVDNPDDLKAAFIAGALTAQASDAGAAIAGRQFEEGVNFFMAMNGLDT